MFDYCNNVNLIGCKGESLIQIDRTQYLPGLKWIHNFVSFRLLAGGSNMRGDQKWPPEEVKKQSEIDNEHRKALAQGPVFRPKRVAKVRHPHLITSRKFLFLLLPNNDMRSSPKQNQFLKFYSHFNNKHFVWSVKIFH
jgi:hypothetical protein